jgi:hypothetical protein
MIFCDDFREMGGTDSNVCLVSHFVFLPIAAMSGFDANVVHSVPILADKPLGTTLESASDTERMLLDFLLQYRVGGVFLYRSVHLNSLSKSHLQI